MKVSVNTSSDGKNRKIKSAKERVCVNYPELAHSKINQEEVLQYGRSDTKTARVIPPQKKNESRQVFHDEGNVTQRSNKNKSLTSGKQKVQAIHKLKELRVVLKRLPEVCLRKINKNLSFGNRFNSRTKADEKNSCTFVNKSNCSEIQIANNSDSLFTPDAVLYRGIPDSSAMHDNELKSFLHTFKTNHPEILVKEPLVSLHKLPTNLHSRNWSQMERIYERCNDCRSIAANNRINQENAPYQTAVNKSTRSLKTNKKVNVLCENKNSNQNCNELVQRKSRRKWRLNCLYCSEDVNNESVHHNKLLGKGRKNVSVRTLKSKVLAEIDTNEDKMDFEENNRTVHCKQRTNNKELGRMRKVSPMELIQAVKYAMHVALTEPWLQLDVSGPPECCEFRHRNMALRWITPDRNMSELFRNGLSQGVWLPSLLHMMISAGAVPEPEDVQNFLLFVMASEDLMVKENALTIIQMLFNLYPPCCLHTGSYYRAVFRKPHKVEGQESNGLLLSMVAALHSQLSCKVEMAASVTYSALVIKVVVSALAADLASWLSRHQTKKCTKAKLELPLAQIALGQTDETQINFCDVKNIVELCVCDRRKTVHHDVFMDLVRLIAELYRIHYAVPHNEYPGLGTDCHLLASEIVSQIEHSGMESERIGQFLCVLKPNWLSMLVGQKLLEKLQGPLRGSVIDTVTSYILDYKDFLKREVTHAENLEKDKISIPDAKTKKVNKKDHKGEVQLHRSCRRGNINVVNRLLEVPGIDVNVPDNAGWTPLHEAVHYGHTACVQALLNFIPSPGSPYIYTAARADCGTTPLISAAIAGDADMCHLLLEHTGIVLLEDILEGTEIKPQLKEHIPEAIQALLKKAKLKYGNIIAKHLGISLSVEIWTRMHPLFAPLVCSHMATYNIPLVRQQFGPVGCGTVQGSSTHVEYATIQQIMRTLRSFERMREVIKQLCKRHEIPVSTVYNFQSYF